MLEAELNKATVEVRFRPSRETAVGVDPGELDSLLLNLIDNAVYWLGSVDKKRGRMLEIRVRRLPGGERVQVAVHDSGPGVSPDDANLIFWPGVTNKPGGIGMGLTIASEIVEAYEGKLALIEPGDLGGASFQFDLPLLPET